MDGTAVEQLRAGFSVPRVVGESIATPAGWTLHDPASLVKPGPLAFALPVSTLGAVRDYLKANRDGLAVGGLIVHVSAPHQVTVSGPLDARARVRESVVTATCTDSTVGFVGKFWALDEFIIGLQSRFLDLEDRARVLTVLGNVKQEAIKTSTDDGVTQIVQTRAGVALAHERDVPNPVKLAPFRTFREVTQPVSPFVLRVNPGANGYPTQAALFEADAGTWKLTATDRVADWLREALTGIDVAILA